ncbi:MAG: hypothetical protein PVI23_09185 [Maricaulaceae bacterium]|jgi:hypothetical protein
MSLGQIATQAFFFVVATVVGCVLWAMGMVAPGALILIVATICLFVSREVREETVRLIQSLFDKRR